MTHCLICHESFFEKLNWHYVLGLATPPPICEQCSQKLEKIEGEICNKCGRPFANLASQFRDNELCTDCVKWNEHNDALIKNRSLYVYNDFLQEIIAKWKYRGDAELVKLFSTPLKKAAKQFPVDLIVPIPLSDERHYERGFNQSTLLAEQLPYPIVEGLKRPKDAPKQSKKTRTERISQEEAFKINPTSLDNLQNQSILLVDDIYTTGATLHAAAKTLKEYGASSVFSLTIARS